MPITRETGASFLQEIQPCFILLLLPLYCTCHQSNQIQEYQELVHILFRVIMENVIEEHSNFWRLLKSYPMDSWRNYLQACTWLCLLTWEYLKNSWHPQKVLKKKKITFLNTEYLPAWRFKTQPLIFFCKVSLSLLILTQSFLSWESERNTTQVFSS